MMIRGFGALTLGGITGIVAAAVADSSKMTMPAWQGIESSQKNG